MEKINPIVLSLDVAIRVKGATFRWASAEPPSQFRWASAELPSEKSRLSKATLSEKTQPATQNAEMETTQKPLAGPFSIPNLNLEVPRGRLVGIVGPVGSGKSSILQGVSSHMLLPIAAHRCLSAHRRDEYHIGKCGVWRPSCILPAERYVSTRSPYKQASIRLILPRSLDSERHFAREYSLRPVMGRAPILASRQGRQSGDRPRDLAGRGSD